MAAMNSGFSFEEHENGHAPNVESKGNSSSWLGQLIRKLFS